MGSVSTGIQPASFTWGGFFFAHSITNQDKPMNKAFPWMCAALIALGVSAVAGGESLPIAAPQITAQAVPAGVCPRGHAAVWIDSANMECLKELP